MLVMFRAKYPASSLKRAIEVFQSPEPPKRSDAGREVATFVHGDHGGYTNYLLFDVDDERVGELVYRGRLAALVCHVLAHGDHVIE